MSASSPAVDVRVGSTLVGRSFTRRIVGRRVAVACIAYLALIVVVAVIAPIVMPGVAREHAGDLLATRQGPSWHHLLGTDTLGRDVLDRILVGTRLTMVGVAEALIVVLALGVPLGLVAGFLGGWIDRVVGWLADLTFSMPAIIIVLVVLSVFPRSMLAGMVTLGVIAAPGLMRVVRSATLPLREELFIAAARVSGLSRPYIMSRHVLPRIAGPVIVQASLFSAGALLVQTGLSFLDLLVAPPAPSWGGMVADGTSVIVLAPWLIWPPGIVIASTILAFGLLGDILRDATAERWSPAMVRRQNPRLTVRGRPHKLSLSETEMGSETATLLRIDRLSISFPTTLRSIRAVEDVTFDIKAGETVGIVGESGCGKTVTAMSILGLLPGNGEIESGSILFSGQKLSALTERELEKVRGKEIGLVSQEPMISLNPVFRIGSQLIETLRRHHRISRGEARIQMIELLRSVRLRDPESVALRYPHELSGGMAQRVAIARSLAGDPKLLIADEPTTALDVTVQAEILGLLRELQSERGMAILLVTHDWGVVADICDRVVVMYAGQVVERADVDEIFRQPLHPYTEALLASNPHHAPEDRLLPTIPGAVPRPGAWPVGCHFHPRCSYVTDICRRGAIPLEQLSSGRETRCIRHDELVS